MPILRPFGSVWLLAVLASGCAASSAGPQHADAQEALVIANRILAMEGLVGPYGHVSARSGPDRFLIAAHRSPDSVERRHLAEVPVELSEAAVRDRNWYREIFIHSETYGLLPAVGAVVHVHAPYAVALGTLDGADRVRPTTNPGANLGEFIPIYRATGLIETPETARRVAEALQGQNGILLRGHGAVVVGETVQQAVLRAIYLELEARAQMMARAAGTPLFYTPGETTRFRRTAAVKHAWQYYVEKLRRLEASSTRGQRLD